MIIPINIAVEDTLSEAVLRQIIKRDGRYAIGVCYRRNGYGYLKKTIRGFNNAAKGTPYIVLADLEAKCPPEQLRKWLPVPMHSNLIFRIAVREIEAWLLADGNSIASFLGISRNLLPTDVDSIDDPKQCLINLARRSRRRELREAIVPDHNTTAKIGPDYNGQLSFFVSRLWNLSNAVKRSDSLCRATKAINSFQPIWDARS